LKGLNAATIEQKQHEIIQAIQDYRKTLDKTQ